MLFTVFEYVAESSQVVLEKPATTSSTCDAGEHAGIGSRIDHPIAGGQIANVTGTSEIAMNEFNTQPLDPHAICFRPWTHQVVHASHADTFNPFEKTFSESIS